MAMPTTMISDASYVPLMTILVPYLCMSFKTELGMPFLLFQDADRLARGVQEEFQQFWWTTVVFKTNGRSS